MIYTFFCATLKPGMEEEHQRLQEALLAEVQQMPGFVSYKSYRAQDGEQLAVEVFADYPSLQGWMDHPAHQQARELGKTRFYSAYRVVVCEDPRQYAFTAASGT